jgi:tRNA-dihydrouridine synthase 2
MPFRLMALEYGADIVYSEEIVDRKLATTKRVQNGAF